MKLPRVRHMRQHVAAAAPVAERVAAIGRCRQDIDGFGEQDPFTRALDARTHTLAGYRAPHEHDLAVEPREHPPAGCGLFDIEGEKRIGHNGPLEGGPHR